MAKSFRTHFKQSPATESMKSSHTNSTAVDRTSVVSTDSENKNKNYADKSYIKSNYEFKPFCNSRFASSTENMLTRLQNSLAMGFNHFKDGRLPQYIVVVLDDDLITYLDFKKEGATTCWGSGFNGWLKKLRNCYKIDYSSYLSNVRRLKSSFTGFRHLFTASFLKNEMTLGPDLT